MSAVVLKALWIYGLAAVVAMLTAAVIKLIVVVLGRLDRPPVARPAAPSAAASRSAAPAGVPAAHVAAIAAAVHATLGAHRVVHIEDRRSGGHWSAGGRSSQHHSHAGTDRRRTR